MHPHQRKSVGHASFDHNVISPVSCLLVNLLSEVYAVIFCRLLVHQKSYDVDTLGFTVFFHASPIDFNPADTAVWHQSKIQ